VSLEDGLLQPAEQDKVICGQGNGVSAAFHRVGPSSAHAAVHYRLLVLCAVVFLFPHHLIQAASLTIDEGIVTVAGYTGPHFLRVDSDSSCDYLVKIIRHAVDPIEVSPEALSFDDPNLPETEGSNDGFGGYAQELLNGDFDPDSGNPTTTYVLLGGTISGSDVDIFKFDLTMDQYVTIIIQSSCNAHIGLWDDATGSLIGPSPFIDGSTYGLDVGPVGGGIVIGDINNNGTPDYLYVANTVGTDTGSTYNGNILRFDALTGEARPKDSSGAIFIPQNFPGNGTGGYHLQKPMDVAYGSDNNGNGHIYVANLHESDQPRHHILRYDPNDGNGQLAWEQFILPVSVVSDGNDIVYVGDSHPNLTNTDALFKLDTGDLPKTQIPYNPGTNTEPRELVITSGNLLLVSLRNSTVISSCCLYSC